MNQQKLSQLIRHQRVASLDTLYEDAPLVSIMPYAPASDFSAFYIHVSQLTQHTKNLFTHAQVGLLIAEPETAESNPQTLARLSIQGHAQAIDRKSPQYQDVKTLYLARFPKSAVTFQLGDFHLFAIHPQTARYVAGFGQIFDLTTQQLQQAANN